jgi:hypothetical protein
MKLQEMSRKPSATKLNRVVESRFGYSIDFDKLTFKKAYRLASGLSESIGRIRREHGAGAVEKNATYMEMLMVRESLHTWMRENKQQFITESEMAKSEAILAAKAIVDSVQDMLEKISKLQSEQMPALLDSIRDQIGTEQAEQFKAAMTPMITDLSAQLGSARETADTAARGLAGEQVAQPMDMGMGAPEGGMGPDEMAGMAAGNVEGGMPPSDMDGGDEFAAADAAAGGAEELGRERR